jgi:hypothetical protein
VSDPVVVYATDLDQTLIYSRRAAHLDPDFTADLLPVESVADRPISFVTAALLALLDEVWEACVVVPVTTRSLAQYDRLELFDAPRQPEWAVTTNGGNLLHHGEVDVDWNRSLHRSLAETSDDLSAIVESVAREAGPWIDHVRVADDLFAYTIVDRNEFPAAVEHDLRQVLAARGWLVSVQGRKLYAVPEQLCKSAALAEVQDRLGTESSLIAAGDSLLDLEMLRAADRSLRPAHGELHEIGEPADVITATCGPAAGEDLLRAVLDLLGTAGAGREVLAGEARHSL